MLFPVMRNLLLVPILSSVLCGCNAPECTVSGKFALEPGDTICLFGSDGGVLARCAVGPDSSFVLRRPAAGGDIVFLSDRERLQRPVPVFVEPGAVRIVPDARRGYVAAGTPLNDSLGALAGRLEALRAVSATAEESGSDRKSRELLARAVSENLDNLLGVYLFAGTELRAAVRDSVRLSAAEVRWETFSSAVRKHPFAQEVRGRLEAAKNTRIGSRYTELNLPDADGNLVALSSFAGKGRWVLVDFWAAWCAPSRAELAALRDVYRTFRERGFEIYAVSLDNDAERWRRYLRSERLPWPNVLGVGPDRTGEAAARYCVRSLPANFLVSPEGVVVGKNLTGGALRRKLEECLDR